MSQQGGEQQWQGMPGMQQAGSQRKNWGELSKTACSGGCQGRKRAVS